MAAMASSKRPVTQDRESGGLSHEEGTPDADAIQRRKAGAELLPDGPGLRIAGWTIRTRKCSILKIHEVERWEKKLGTTHLPEMVFGDSTLELRHDPSGLKIYFNPFDALRGWKNERLPPVEVPAAAKWKFSRRPNQDVILDYDYTFTTPYCGSEIIDNGVEISSSSEGVTDAEEKIAKSRVGPGLAWVECKERIDLQALQAKDPILFYDEVVLYEDELADNGVSLLTVKVRVMPSCWFLLLRYWLRVDGVLMRVRDTRMFYAFSSDPKGVPVVLRERSAKEGTFQELGARGLPTDPAAYADASVVVDLLQTKAHFSEKLILVNKIEKERI